MELGGDSVMSKLCTMGNTCKTPGKPHSHLMRNVAVIQN